MTVENIKNLQTPHTKGGGGIGMFVGVLVRGKENRR